MSIEHFEYNEELDDFAIELNTTEDYLQSAKVLSDFIQDLPLNNKQNDELIRLIKDHVHHARTGALGQGIAMAFKAEQPLSTTIN